MGVCTVGLGGGGGSAWLASESSGGWFDRRELGYAFVGGAEGDEFGEARIGVHGVAFGALGFRGVFGEVKEPALGGRQPAVVGGGTRDRPSRAELAHSLRFAECLPGEGAGGAQAVDVGFAVFGAERQPRRRRARFGCDSLEQFPRYFFPLFLSKGSSPPGSLPPTTCVQASWL